MVVGIVAGYEDMPLLSYVSAGLAGVAALKEPLENLFITDFTSKKRRRYMDRCDLFNHCLYDMFLWKRMRTMRFRQRRLRNIKRLSIKWNKHNQKLSKSKDEMR